MPWSLRRPTPRITASTSCISKAMWLSEAAPARAKATLWWDSLQRTNTMPLVRSETLKPSTASATSAVASASAELNTMWVSFTGRSRPSIGAASAAPARKRTSSPSGSSTITPSPPPGSSERVAVALSPLPATRRMRASSSAGEQTKVVLRAEGASPSSSATR